MTTGAPNSYLRDSVLTAAPEQLQLMLYDGAIRFASQGRDALQAGDYETSYEKFSRAQAIAIEMEAGLRREVNPQLCERMAAIYGFIYRKLVDASVNKDAAAVDDALKVLRLERETWVLLLDKINIARAQEGPAHLEPALEDGSLCVEG